MVQQAFHFWSCNVMEAPLSGYKRAVEHWHFNHRLHSYSQPTLLIYSFTLSVLFETYPSFFAMLLRNQKDTVELTVEEIKGEVYPDNLDMPYSWPAQVGEKVWIKVDMKWRRGVVLKDEGHAWTDRVSFLSRIFLLAFFSCW